MFASESRPLDVFARSTGHFDGTGIVGELEHRVAALTGFSHGLGMSSATAALRAIFDACGLVPADEVIAPSLTAPETIAPLLHMGCVVVFADINPGTLTIDPSAVKACLSPQTKAIVAVDLCGQPHDTVGLREIADRANLAYVDDSAQAFGARRDGHTSGYRADAVVLSLNAQKDLAGGEGGIALTDSIWLYQELLRRTQHQRRQARELGTERVNEFPINARLNPLSAVAALAKFQDVLIEIEQRRHQAREAIEILNGSGLVEPHEIPQDCEPTFAFLTASWADTPRPIRLLRMFQEGGISASLRDLPVQPLHRLPCLGDRFLDQIRIPHPLIHTEHQARRRFCVEVT